MQNANGRHTCKEIFHTKKMILVLDFNKSNPQCWMWQKSVQRRNNSLREIVCWRGRQRQQQRRRRRRPKRRQTALTANIYSWWTNLVRFTILKSSQRETERQREREQLSAHRTNKRMNERIRLQCAGFWLSLHIQQVKEDLLMQF